MDEQIQINKYANSFINNTFNASNDNTSITQTVQYYNKKKNPRDMSIEELEEYIQKNMSKTKNIKNYESHSLNASFTCIDKIDNEHKNNNLFSVKKEENNNKFMNKIENNNLKININNLFNKNELSKEKNYFLPFNNENANNNKIIKDNPQLKKINEKNYNNIMNNNYNSDKNIENKNYENKIENKNQYEKNIFNVTFPQSNLDLNISSPSFKNMQQTLNYTLNNDNDDLNECFNNYNSGKIDSKNKINFENIKNQKSDSNNDSAINYIKTLKNKIVDLNQENEYLKNIISQNKSESNKILKEIEVYKNKITQLQQYNRKNIEQIENNKNYCEKQIIEIKTENQLLKELLEEIFRSKFD